MIKGKKVSKIGMILAVMVALMYNLLYVFFEHKIPSTDEQKSILMLSGFIVVFFSPVYVSIILDKFAIMLKKEN